jgi:hypothetical protein
VRLRVFSLMIAVAVATVHVGAAGARPRIAVLGVEPRDDGDSRSQQRTAALARALTDGLRGRAAQATSGYDLAPGSNKDLMELKLLSDCLDEEAACMSAIGRDLGTDVLLYGRVTRTPSAYDVTLRSIVVATGRPGDLTLDRTVAAPDATEDAMRKLAPLVFPEEAPAHDTALIVETNVAAGRILVNGAERGVVTPKKVTVIRGLPPGPVMLAVESPGHQRAEVSVEIRPGQAARATMRLEPEVAVAPAPAPPVEDEPGRRGGGAGRVLFWTSLVATGAGVAAFTVTGLKVRSIENEQDDAISRFDYMANGVQYPNDACREAANDGNQDLVDICDRGRSMATMTNVLIGATAVAAVATAIFYWRGYLAEDARPRERAKRKDQRLLVGPEIYHGGGGVGAVIQF